MGNSFFSKIIIFALLGDTPSFLFNGCRQITKRWSIHHPPSLNGGRQITKRWSAQYPSSFMAVGRSLSVGLHNILPLSRLSADHYANASFSLSSSRLVQAKN